MNFTRTELLSLYDLLTNRLFEIPNYQRTYSWKKKQRQDLFNDILKIRQKDKEHFMATIVCMVLIPIFACPKGATHLNN